MENKIIEFEFQVDIWNGLTGERIWKKIKTNSEYVLESYKCIPIRNIVYKNGSNTENKG